LECQKYFSWLNAVMSALFCRMKVRQWALILGFALVAMLGYWFAGTAVPEKAARKSPESVAKPRLAKQMDEPAPKFRRGERPPVNTGDVEAAALGALEGQRVLVFKDQESLRRFLERAGKGIRLLGRLDALNALRVGFSDHADLSALLDGSEEQSFIFPVSTPPLPEGSVQPGALALGNKLLEWLGVSGDNSGWGAGVKIAILDTGVAASTAFNTIITRINLVPLSADPSQQNGHGTAVASMIIGDNELTPGVAPASSILSIRVADDLGQSDSFVLAQGIIAAVDAGARLINISMGGFGQSALLENAVAYAREHGALIFAPTGNNGVAQIYYPAAYEGVITIGAVDAGGNHLDFSNSGSQIDISAPGYAINAAWPGDQVAAVTGTSFSTPIVVGAVAAVMTEAGSGILTPWQAWQLVVTHLNDGGAAGADPLLGAGMPDIGRVLDAGTPGIYDAALASQRIIPPDAGNPYGQVEILVQNRGTEPLVNTAVGITIGGNSSTGNITTLAPNSVATIRVPITRPPVAGSGNLVVDSRVFLTGGVTDAKPSNDSRIES
jgi:hypothetical protein